MNDGNNKKANIVLYVQFVTAKKIKKHSLKIIWKGGEAI